MSSTVRVASGVYEGGDIPPYYDSLFMLLMTAGADRKDAIRVMDRSLGRNLRVEGIKTLQPLLLSIIRHPSFIAGEFSARFIEEHMDELISMFSEKNSEKSTAAFRKWLDDKTGGLKNKPLSIALEEISEGKINAERPEGVGIK